VIVNGTGAQSRPAFRPWAVIPQKSFARAKARLAPALGTVPRRALARELFGRVLGACSGCGELAGVLVATDGAEVAALAARGGALTLRDPGPQSAPLSTSVDAALVRLRTHGATHALVIMADLPQLTGRDLRELLAALRETRVVIAPDLQRRGTSALGLRLDLPFNTAFGRSDSLQRHLREAARTAGGARVVYNPRVALDVDTPEDLRAV
jgi:2-phospho-L-lactate guanylyltransferase